MSCRNQATAMAPDLAHAINIGTWQDETQSALCNDCQLRLPIDAWTIGPCVPKDGVRLRDVFPTSPPTPEPPTTPAPTVEEEATAGAGSFKYEAMP